jgi:hypothetical protein
MTEPSKPVFEFRAAAPARQNRWGVLLRIFLVIPQVLFAGLVLYAAVFLTFFAWFYILFTGRNPYHDFNSKALRTYQRFAGYLYFLTSEYPAFSLDEDSNYVLVSQLDQGELGRAKVFFRIILMIPVAIVSWVLSYGLTLLGFVSWLILLIRGTLPRPIHYAVVVIIRFNGRVAAYVLLLQDPYPRGLFGDKDQVSEYGLSSSLDRSSSDAPSGPPVHSDDSATDASGGADNLPSAPSTFRPYPTRTEFTEEDTDSDGEKIWRLALSSGSKAVVVVALVIGVVAAGLYVRFAHFHWTVRQGIESTISASTWNSRYRGDVINLRNETTRYQSTFDAKHPSWSALLGGCQAVQNSYKAFDSVPYYPFQGPDQTLISGLQSIYSGYNDCLTVVAPYKVTKAMHLLATQFNQGAADLATFLQQS